MGYDIECIIDIHNYPGEYFCPVCRTLVYPNDALQSQCTHVFCKPCLSHVVNSTRACPYDGYLVTEADSKPLAQSDTAYAENIGKVKVRCLYHRSGCTWDGCLAEATSHCLNCTYGYSPVICNRCSVQIVHRQVNEHAQTCPGAYPVQQAPNAAAQAFPASSAAQAVPASSVVTTAAGAASLNPVAVQAGAPTSQAQNSVPAPLQPGQDANQKADANPQPTALTAEQLYQQQYQQYYQQYASYGYDQYQQAYQQYYPYQQVSVQQYQQPVAQVSGQPNVPIYAQAVSTQVYPSSQTQVQSQALTQHPGQQQIQSYSAQPSAVQPQLNAQTQVQQYGAAPVQPQTNAQTQVQQYGAAAVNSQLETTGAPTLYQPPVNLQQQPYSAMQPHGLSSSQSHHGLPASLPQQHNPTPTQPLAPQPLVQAQYPPPHPSAQNPQLSYYHMQSQTLSSQSHPQQVQPQLHPQPHLQPSQPNQPTALGGQSNQPTPLGGRSNQPAPLGGRSNQPAPLGGQSNQPAQPQLLQASGIAVSGYQSYMQPQLPYQQSSSAQPVGGSFPSNQMQGQLPSQPPSMRPSLAPVPNPLQGPSPQTQVPVQQQQYHQQNPQLSNPNQQRPVIHSGQHPGQQYAQQLSSSASSQLSHQNQHPLQQSQIQSQGAPPHMMTQNTNSYPQLQQNAPLAPGSQFQQPHSYAGRAMMQNYGVPFQLQPLAKPSTNFFGGTQVKPAQFGSYEQSANQTYSNNTQNQMQAGSQRQAFQPETSATSGSVLRQDDNVSEKGVASRAGMPSENATETVVKSEVGVSAEQETLGARHDKPESRELLTGDVNNEFSGKKDSFSQHISKLSSIEDHSRHSLENDASGKQGTLVDTQTEGVESQMRQKKTVSNSGEETFMSTTGPFNQHKSSGVPTFQTTLPPGLPHMQIPGHAANPVRTPESGALPQSRLPLNPSNQFQQAVLHKQAHDSTHGLIPVSAGPFSRGPIPFGTSHGLSLTPPQKLDGGLIRAPGRGSFAHPSILEPNALKMNGEPGLDRSAFGSQDQRFKGVPREHLNHTLSQDQGPGMFRRDMEHWTPRSPDKEYFGRKAPLFGEASGHNRPVEAQVNPFRDNRYPPFPGFLRRGENTSNHFGSFSMGEGRGLADLPQKPHSGEPFLANMQRLPRLGEPGFRSNFPLQGFPNEGSYAGDMAHFDSLRKRKYISMGWCRICKVDCETVEGLDMHSQTREHQKMSMDMVMIIKQQNMKKPKFLSDRTGREFGNKKKNNGLQAQGKKP